MKAKESPSIAQDLSFHDLNHISVIDKEKKI
jgi:hypothetical protein